jgi:hypothetical protein
VKVLRDLLNPQMIKSFDSTLKIEKLINLSKNIKNLKNTKSKLINEYGIDPEAIE